MSIFRNVVMKIQLSLTHDTNEGCFVKTLEHYGYAISRCILLKMRNILEKGIDTIEKIYIFKNFFFSKIVPFLR
jgi:hypothetical protein